MKFRNLMLAIFGAVLFAGTVAPANASVYHHHRRHHHHYHHN